MLTRFIKYNLRYCLCFLALTFLCATASAQNNSDKMTAGDWLKKGIDSIENKGCGYALEYFDQAIRMEPGNAEFYLVRSKCTKLWSKEDALEDIETAIRLKPDLLIAYVARAQIYFHEFNVTEMSASDAANALADLNKAIDLAPNEPEPFYIRGKLYYHYFKDRTKAYADFGTAIKNAPSDEGYLMGRASHYRLDGNSSAAIADYSAILVLNPKNLDAASARGGAYYATSNFSKAVADFSRAIETKPDDPFLYEQRASAYRNLKKISLAKADEKKAAELNRLLEQNDQ